MTQQDRVFEDVVDVPLLDLKPQFEQLRDEITAAIERVVNSQHFVMGPEVSGLERSVAAYCQADHGIGVSSGTDALLVALMALEVGEGDAVITTPYTFFATGGAIARVGARPIFCDIDPTTFNLDPEAVSRFIGEHCTLGPDGLTDNATGRHVKAIIPVHLYGQMADMDPLVELARKNGLRLIEDAAQAIGSEDRDGRRAGSVGDIGCFSFFPSKNLGAFGDGGMCTTNDPDLAERMRVLRVHGGKPKYHHAFIGGNFRLDALQAAVLSVKLEHLDDWTAARQRNAGFYDQAIAAAVGDSVQTSSCRPGYRHIYNQYVIRAERRDELRAFLGEANIGTEIYYPIPLHEQECFAYLGYAPEDCPVSAKAARESLAIPVYPELAESQLRYVVDRIAAFYA